MGAFVWAVGADYIDLCIGGIGALGHWELCAETSQADGRLCWKRLVCGHESMELMSQLGT